MTARNTPVPFVRRHLISPLIEESSQTLATNPSKWSKIETSLCFMRKDCGFESGHEHELFLVASSYRELAHIGKAYWVSSHGPWTRPSNRPGSWSFIITPTLRMVHFNVIQTWIQRNIPFFISKDLWPTRSPDLNPLNFSVWSILKTRVFATPNTSPESLKTKLQREREAFLQEQIHVACNAFVNRLKACGVVNCRGNYNKENRRPVFHLPKEQSERQKWLDVLPPRENFVVNPDKFFIHEIHWGADPPLIKLRGGSLRPRIPPRVFNVPASCLPSPKPAPRLAKVEDQQLRYFLQKDKITSFDAFKPERNLQKQYKNLIISRSEERLVCLFMTDYFSECSLSVNVKNKPTLCSPLTLSAFKNGISVPLFKILHPNNGLRSYTQFNETVCLAMNYDIPFDKTIQNVVTLLQAHTSACVDTEKEKKLVFLTRQLELSSQNQFSMNDYCFALQSYPV
ncbi:hypothetical protein FHG87_014015 [Trinorchestia longiramus]|nr:hypothetical protein FHG87_014015 [Trinorchestia longiramus]